MNWKNASSEMPVTISGVTSERYIDPASTGDLRFQSPYAAIVPMAVESNAETIAMMTLLRVAQARSALFTTARYQSSENPSQTVNLDLLKLKTTSTISGK